MSEKFLKTVGGAVVGAVTIGGVIQFYFNPNHFNSRIWQRKEYPKDTDQPTRKDDGPGPAEGTRQVPDRGGADEQASRGDTGEPQQEGSSEEGRTGQQTEGNAGVDPDFDEMAMVAIKIVLTIAVLMAAYAAVRMLNRSSRSYT
jgi:hypothetical protein